MLEWILGGLALVVFIGWIIFGDPGSPDDEGPWGMR